MIKDINKIFGKIDYKNIDKGIKKLVKEINKFEGIRTFGSCEGDCKSTNNCAYVIIGSYDIRKMNDFFKVCNDICWNKYNRIVKWNIDFLANPSDCLLYNNDNDLLVVSMQTIKKEETPELVKDLTKALQEYNKCN